MDKRKIIVIIVAVLAIGAVGFLLIRWLAPSVGQKAPPGAAGAPAGVIKDANTRSGVLYLNAGDAKFTSAGTTYDLFIGKAGQSSKILKDRGLKTGDTVIIIGQVSGSYIEVSGLSY